MKNGGRARITSLLLNYFYKIKIINLFLFTKKNKQNNEYIVPHIKRIIIKNNLVHKILKYKIDILIYQLDNIDEIKQLNKKKFIKIIFYIHSSNFDWVYSNYSIFKEIYNEYINCKYIISLVPFENDYLFKKWKIRSLLIDNFITYKYNYIIPSNLSSKIILMLGRGNDKKKRFNLGIQSMEYILPHIYKCELKIISNLTGINNLKNLVYNLNLESNIKFVGYSSTPEIYFKNASLNLFPSISESFGLALSEAKIYGIPSILMGIDYVSISKGGTIIIYDDTPESLAKKSIEILKNDHYKLNLSIEARKSMKKFNNNFLLDRWIKLILCIYNGDKYFTKFMFKEYNIQNNCSINILNNQINLLNKRKVFTKNISLNDYENLSFISNLK